VTEPPGPSTYTPFFRRFFTDERAKELEETTRLYEHVKAQHDAFRETPITVGTRVYEYLAALPDDIQQPFLFALHDLTTDERVLWELPPPDFGRMSMKEFVEYRNFLAAKQYFHANQTDVLQLFHEGLVRLLCGLARELPATEQPSPFTIPLIYALAEPKFAVEQIFGTLMNGPYEGAGLFRKVSAQLYRNLCRASGRDSEESRKPYKYPRESTLALDALVDSYLADTPFQDLFKIPVPLKLTHEDRFNHMHIVGGSGAGKTTLIENLVRHDLRSDDPPSLVVVDPHSDFIRKLAHADLGIGDRLIIIDPRDVKHPPALNIFAMNRERLASYDDVTREQVTAGVIQTFDYLFSGLLGADLTAKQGVFFRYVARLMLTLPDALGRNATILDMMRLMGDAAPYQGAIERLPDIPREFFERDFASKTFAQTKEQIRYRLQAIIENPTLARLFTSPDTKVDLFTEMNRGAVILVDTAKDFLKGGSPTFGRIIISLTLQAVLERSAIAAAERKPTFLIVDEAASFFDSNIDDLLTEARKYRCGCVFAHQYLDQASSSLRASLAANTGIKFASGLSASDARAMAPEMRTTPDFILDQPRLQFAAHIRNVTPHAVSIPIQPVTDKRRLSSAAFEDLMASNRARVSLPSVSAPAQPGGTSPARAERDEDISREW
jgi:hypothetical protein